jgi:hypothetical protein
VVQPTSMTTQTQTAATMVSASGAVSHILGGLLPWLVHALRHSAHGTVALARLAGLSSRHSRPSSSSSSSVRLL